VARKEDERLHIRISSEEKERLRAIAEEQNKAIAEMVKEHLKSLPDPKNKEDKNIHALDWCSKHLTRTSTPRINPTKGALP
jgi:hypothetical protein